MASASWWSCRVGVALSDNDREDAESLLRDADNALHKARRSETASIEFFHAEMHAQAVRALQIEAELRAALKTGGLTVFYQPIVNADSRIVGVEALLRWPHPERGMISPAVFIPLAEQSGLIQPLGQWVLATAWLLRWLASSRLQVQMERAAVNARMIYEILDTQPHQRDKPGAAALSVTDAAKLLRVRGNSAAAQAGTHE